MSSAHARPYSARRIAPLLCGAVLLAVGCSTSSDPATAPTSESATSAEPNATHSPSDDASVSTSGEPTSDVGDMYDVGGHRLYMSCTGRGSPTVVYLHGWVNDSGYNPHIGAEGIAELLGDQYRVCLYDRRNVGNSDTVDAIQTPDDMLTDMERVLRAGDAKPPYILMAASYGGLLAYDYLNHHPDQVTGMVLIDAMFPDELRLDRFLPREFRFIAFREDDLCCQLERISQFDQIRRLQRFVGNEPKVPLVYLASKQEPRNQNNYGAPGYDARVLEAQADYVDRFEPGQLIWVDAPHYMEPVVPDRIAAAVRRVDRLAGS